MVKLGGDESHDVINPENSTYASPLTVHIFAKKPYSAIVKVLIPQTVA